MGLGKEFRERILLEESGSTDKDMFRSAGLDLLYKGRLKCATPESLLMREDNIACCFYDAREV